MPFFSGYLWCHLDATVQHNRQTHNSTADATVEVQRYMTETHIHRTENPLTFWKTHKTLYPNLFVFSKAGEVVSKKWYLLTPKAVEQLLFLNKNNLSHIPSYPKHCISSPVLHKHVSSHQKYCTQAKHFNITILSNVQFNVINIYLICLMSKTMHSRSKPKYEAFQNVLCGARAMKLDLWFIDQG